MRVLVTGATGFIGRNLIRELEAAHELRLLDQARPEEATMFAGATRLVAPFRTEWPFVQADITDEAAMLAAMDGMAAVIHLAGEPRGLPEIGVATFRDNALGTFVAIDTAQRAGVGRFFCASSINAFGTFHWRLSGRPAGYTKMPLDEAFDPVPEDPYSLSKLVNEKTCAAYHRAYGMTTAAFPLRRRLVGGALPAEARRGPAAHGGVVGPAVPVGARDRRGPRPATGARGAGPARFRHVHARRRGHPVPGADHGAARPLPPGPGRDGRSSPAGPRPAAVHRPGAAHLRLRADPPPRTVAGAAAERSSGLAVDQHLDRVVGLIVPQ